MRAEKNQLAFREEIRFLRKMAGFNAVELARFMGVHPVTVSKWETGTSNIGASNDRVLRLICFTGMLQQLFEQKDDRFLGTLAERAKKFASINVRMLLERIEEKSEGPKTVTIDPSLLSGLGTAEEEALVPAESVH